MQSLTSLSLGLLVCCVWQSQAAASKFVDYNGKDHPVSSEQNRLRLERFLGLRHKRHHPTVITEGPKVHHGLHMLNHRVSQSLGPLKGKLMQPFGRSLHKHVMGNSSLDDELDANLTISMAMYAMEKKKTKGWDAIKEARADMCVKMLEKHGIKFDPKNKDKCVSFMDKECGDKPPAICTEWDTLLANVGAPSPAAPGAPGVAGPPDGLFAPMNEGEKIPSQGFSGELVAHDNMVTQTEDWRSEYGPHHGPSYERICAQYPDNLWCKLRGYHDKKAAPAPEEPEPLHISKTLVALVLALMCLCFAAFSCLK